MYKFVSCSFVKSRIYVFIEDEKDLDQSSPSFPMNRLSGSRRNLFLVLLDKVIDSFLSKKLICALNRFGNREREGFNFGANARGRMILSLIALECFFRNREPENRTAFDRLESSPCSFVKFRIYLFIEKDQ